MNSAQRSFFASRVFLLAGVFLVFLFFVKGQVRADWTYDNTGPATTVAVECPAGTAVANSGVCAAASAVVKIICSDAASGGTGCAEISYWINDGVVTKQPYSATGDPLAFSDQTLTFTLAGTDYPNGVTVKIEAKSKDGAGNIGSAATPFSFKFDSTPPVTTISVSCPSSIDRGGVCSGNSATVDITCTDTGGACKTITYYVNYKDTGESFTASTDYTVVTPVTPLTKTLTLSANTRGFTVGANSTDAAGNKGADALPFPFDFTKCTLDLLANSITVVMGESGQASASVTSNSSAADAITKVDFSSADTATATVNPGTDNTGPSYTTTITPVKVGSTTVSGTGTTSSGLICTDSSPLTINPPSSWWQVRDIDVMTNGNVRSIVPSGCTGACSPYFNLDGLGGFPGVVSYGGASATFNPVLNSDNRLSSKQWLANSGFASLTRYKYDWFVSQARTATTIDCSSDLNNGNLVSHAAQDKPALVLCDSNATIGGSINLNAKKLLLLVNGNLNINNTVNLEKGKGFFGAIVKGNISVDPSVTASGSNYAVEGIYMSDGTFSTGTGDKKLRVRGSIVGWSGVIFGRDLGSGNNLTPAEFVEYAPDLIMGFPAALMRQQPIWKEVAP